MASRSTLPFRPDCELEIPSRQANQSEKFKAQTSVLFLHWRCVALSNKFSSRSAKPRCKPQLCEPELGFKAVENYEEHGRTSPALAHVPLGSCRPLRQAALQTTTVRIKTNSCIALYHTRLLAATHATALRINRLACIWLSEPIDERITAKAPMRRTTGCCAKMHRIRQPCESKSLHASRFKAQGCQPPHQSTPQTTTLGVKLRSCILLGTLGRASTTTSATRGACCPLPRPLWGCAGREERKRSQAAGVIPSRFGWHGESRREK